MADPYWLERRPNLASVTPDAVVSYECCGPKTMGIDENGTHCEQTVRWSVCRDRRTEGRDLRFIDGMPATEGQSPYGWVRTYQWNQGPGDYLVFAEIRRHGANSEPEVAIVSQHVMSKEEVDGELARLITKTRKEPLASPDEADSLIAQQLLVMDAAAKNGPAMPPAQRADHEKSVNRWREVRKKLAERLATTNGRRRIPIVAVHIDFATQVRRQLNFFLADISPERSPPQSTGPSGADGASGSSGESKRIWRLVDWTAPESRAESSEVDGEGKRDKDAILDAFGDWDWWRSRYPPGEISFEVPSRACGEVLRLQFKTDGATTWDTIIGALSVTAVAAGLVVIGVATLGAAIPAEIATATATTALIMSTASGVGAEIISINVRRAEGIHDTKADAISVLGIVASLFQLRWLKGARVVMPDKPGTFRFLGHVAEGSVNLAQGVLILDGEFEATLRELEHLRNDPNLSPEERARQICALFVRLAETGALTYMSLRADATLLADLAKKRGIPTGKTKLTLGDLKDEAKTIELGAPKATEGKVADGRVKTVAETRETVPALPRPKVESPLKSAPPGTRPREHYAFKKLSKDRIIFVRDSNPARTRKFPFPVTAKPETCKFKTLTKGPYEGLAAAGPEDAVVKELLASNGWDFYRDHEKLRMYLDEKGLTLGSEAEQYIVRNKYTKAAFVGDIDIHGMYDLKNGSRIELSPPEQARVNGEVGSQVVMHGAHDDWKNRISKTIEGKANVNYGPQPPVTAYVDGQAVELRTWNEMREFAQKYGINLEAEYSGIDWDFWRERRTKSNKGTE
jgi:hypothetical protein